MHEFDVAHSPGRNMACQWPPDCSDGPREPLRLSASRAAKVKKAFVRSSIIVAITVATASLASAQETVTLPGNAAGTTTLTAVVSEQARITVPSVVTFNVTNIAVATVASGVSFLADNIVLSS